MNVPTSRPGSPGGPASPGAPMGPGGPRSPEGPLGPCLPGSPYKMTRASAGLMSMQFHNILSTLNN